MYPLVWFLLMDSDTEEPYKRTSASSILRSSIDVHVIGEFLYEVKAKCDRRGYLKDIPGVALLIYKNKAAFDSGEDPLRPSHFLDGLGNTEDEALIVLVPSSTSSGQRIQESRLTGKQNPKRLQRWNKLNEILEINAKRSTTENTAAYSSISWNQVASVFSLTRYVQPRKDMDDAMLDFLNKYILFVTKSFDCITTGKESKRLHFIAPVLICVCRLFDGDVEFVVEEELRGNFVNANGHFDFMLKRGKKAICIVQAKRDNFEQGMAQVLVGCEVAAEIRGLDIVYGIVTNYIQWNFFRSLNGKVEMEECSLHLIPEGTQRDSLKEIAEKMYAMLSD
jgi:hypothetical protein